MELQLTPSEFERIHRKWPERIPVIVLRSPSAAPDLPTLAKKKFIVPKSLTLGQFIYVVRKQIELPPEKALFLFIDDTLPVACAMMSELYERHKSPDGALHVIYTSESTFGGCV